MWLIALEAGFALFVLIFIVWWTMFSGRRHHDGHEDIKRRDQHKEPPAS